MAPTLNVARAVGPLYVLQPADFLVVVAAIPALGSVAVELPPRVLGPRQFLLCVTTLAGGTASVVISSQAPTDTIDGQVAHALDREGLWFVSYEETEWSVHAVGSSEVGWTGSGRVVHQLHPTLDTPDVQDFTEMQHDHAAVGTGGPLVADQALLATSGDVLLGRATAGVGNVEQLACTPFARTLLDDADAATARATLGAGTGSGTVTSVTGTAPLTSTGGATPAIGCPAFVASGASHAAGLVPDPGASADVTKFLREDATWARPPGVKSFQVLTSGTGATYTLPAGITSILVELVGGGGGGGGAANTAANAAAGGGGGAGGYARKFYATAASTYTYTVGAGGAGGAAGNNNGSQGADTTFDNAGTIVTAKKGAGGTGSAAGVVPAVVAGGAGGAVSTNGDVNGAGMSGLPGRVWNGTVAESGQGGSGVLGGGGAACITERNGIAGAGKGAGGSGAVSYGTNAKAGAAGSDGVIVVWEFP